MKIVGLAGESGAGKSWVARFMREHGGYSVLKFMHPCKLAMTRAYRAVGMTDKAIRLRLEGGLKDTPDNLFVKRIGKPAIHDRIINDMRGALPSLDARDLADMISTWGAITPAITPRRCLQDLADLVKRDNPRVLLDMWENALNRMNKAGKAQGIVTDDIRFQTEADAIRAHGGLVVLIRRNEKRALTPHASDRLDFECDRVILNDESDRFRAEIAAL